MEPLFFAHRKLSFIIKTKFISIRPYRRSQVAVYQISTRVESNKTDQAARICNY